MDTGRLEREKLAGIQTYIKGLKNFSDTNTFKFLNSARLNAEKGGFKGLIDHVSKYKGPARHLGDDIPKNITMPGVQQQKPTLARGVRTSLGNTADALKELSKDMKGKGPLGGVAQIGKNIKDLTKKQIKGDLYKEVDNPIVYRKGKDKFLKSKAPWMKDRKIVSETDRGSAIVRKRKALTPLSVGLGMSGASVGAATYALGDKEQPKSKRIANSALDAGLFAVSTPVGIASAFMRTPEKTTQKIKKKYKNKE